MSEPEEFYDEVPTLYRARIMGEDSQVELARRLLKSGMLIEKVVEETGVSVVGPYAVMTRESIQQECNRLYAKAQHDEAQALYHAEQKGMQAKQTEIALNALQMGMSITDIAKLTGLTSERIECLREDIRLITRD